MPETSFGQEGQAITAPPQFWGSKDRQMLKGEGDLLGSGAGWQPCHPSPQSGSTVEGE